MNFLIKTIEQEILSKRRKGMIIKRADVGIAVYSCIISTIIEDLELTQPYLTTQLDFTNFTYLGVSIHLEIDEPPFKISLVY